MLDEQKIASAMVPAARCRFDVHVVQTTGSTNTDLMAQAGELPGGFVLAAESQTAGRGRRGRAWQSRPGDSLTFSLLWKFAPHTALSGLSLAVGVAVAHALDRCGTGGVMLKWPNDLLVATPQGWSKLGGILIEVAGGGGGSAVVIGIGLNIRPPVDAAMIGQAAASMAALGWTGSRNVLLGAVLGELPAVLDRFAVDGFAAFAPAWNARHAFRDRRVDLSDMAGGTVTGIARGAQPDGALVLDTGGDSLHVVSGDVTLRESAPPAIDPGHGQTNDRRTVRR